MLKVTVNFVRCDNGIVVMKKKSMLDRDEITSEKCFKMLHPKTKGNSTGLSR